MSDPTQPDGMKPEAAADDQPNQVGDAAAAGQTTTDDAQAPHQAQAYVDPTIAAEAQVMVLESEIAELKDKFIRAHAEMDNLRKRTEREKADTTKYAITKFAGDVLAVADNLQRALAAFAQSGNEPDPQTKKLFVTIEINAQGQINRFVPDATILSAFNNNGIQINNRIN